MVERPSIQVIQIMDEQQRIKKGVEGKTARKTYMKNLVCTNYTGCPKKVSLFDAM